MTRKKVTLAFITNDSERKASYKKRKKGLIKKVSELSTLCGVEACAIIYSPYDSEPVVWPSPQGAEAVLLRFRRLSDMDQTRKMVNQESFTRQRIKKAEDQLRRIQKENKRRELENFMFQCLAGMASLDDFDLRDASEMGCVVNQTVRDLSSKLEALKVTETGTSSAAPPPLPLPPPEAVPAPTTVDVLHPPPPTLDPSGLGLMVPNQPTGEENNYMESFPWNLVESPTACGSFSGMDDGVFGWEYEYEMTLPYQYMFNQDGTDQAGPSTGSK